MHLQWCAKTGGRESMSLHATHGLFIDAHGFFFFMVGKQAAEEEKKKWIQPLNLWGGTPLWIILTWIQIVCMRASDYWSPVCGCNWRGSLIWRRWAWTSIRHSRVAKCTPKRQLQTKSVNKTRRAAAAANKNQGRRRIQSLAQTADVYPRSRIYLQY